MYTLKKKKLKRQIKLIVKRINEKYVIDVSFTLSQGDYDENRLSNRLKY